MIPIAKVKSIIFSSATQIYPITFKWKVAIYDNSTELKLLEKLLSFGSIKSQLSK